MLHYPTFQQPDHINRLLTEHEGHTGEYWPEVVAVLRINIPQYGPSEIG